MLTIGARNVIKGGGKKKGGRRIDMTRHWGRLIMEDLYAPGRETWIKNEGDGENRTITSLSERGERKMRIGVGKDGLTSSNEFRSP